MYEDVWEIILSVKVQSRKNATFQNLHKIE